MKTAFLFALFSGCVCLMTSGSLWNFNDMIKQVTLVNAIPNYTTYGCHCGLGGSGKPVDATDWCCARHDCCYLNLVRRRCNPKIDGYKFTVSGTRVTCAGDSRECGKLACECDKTASLCFRANKGSYASKYKYKPNFTCKGSKPAC